MVPEEEMALVLVGEAVGVDANLGTAEATCLVGVGDGDTTCGYGPQAALPQSSRSAQTLADKRVGGCIDRAPSPGTNRPPNGLELCCPAAQAFCR